MESEALCDLLNEIRTEQKVMSANISNFMQTFHDHVEQDNAREAHIEKVQEKVSEKLAILDKGFSNIAMRVSLVTGVIIVIGEKLLGLVWK